MNETIEHNIIFSYNFCRVCLKTTQYLATMPNELIKLYQKLVNERVCKEYAMKICMVCEWMLRKYSRFKTQCQTANHLLNEATYLDSKSLQSNGNIVSNHNLTQTKQIILNYTPSLDNAFHSDSNFSVHTHNNGTDITTCNNTMLYSVHTKTCDNKGEDSLYNNDDCFSFTNGYTMENDKYVYENDRFINENDTQDSYVDEDEIPLVLISNMSKRKSKKKCKIKQKKFGEMANPNELETTQELVTNEGSQLESSKKEGKCNRSKKVLRDGFSSRMVQETVEYVVIKLSKEQVLQEMEERSKTDAYVSSPYKCEKCVKGFNFQDVLTAHMEKHSMKNGSFKCEMCGQYCPSAVSLRGHIKSHTTRYKCKICGTVRVSRQHLMEHHAAHSGAGPRYQCLQCTFTTDKRTVMQRHARGHAARDPHACDTCGKLFKNIHYLRLHTARHEASSRHKCPQCPASFLYQSLVRAHVRSAHDRRDFYCVECDLHFKCAESLRVHFKKTKRHRDSTTNTSVCARALTAHHDTRVPRAQHACPHCGCTYTTRDAVRAHVWRVHKRGDARADCPHCRTSFARKSLLKVHLQGACAASTLHSPAQDNQKEEIPQYENKTEV